MPTESRFVDRVTGTKLVVGLGCEIEPDRGCAQHQNASHSRDDEAAMHNVHGRPHATLDVIVRLVAAAVLNIGECSVLSAQQPSWRRRPFETIIPLLLRAGNAMRDMQAHLEQLRVQIAECEMIRDLATDKAKRELFEKLAKHYAVLAGEVERAIKQAKASGG